MALVMTVLEAHVAPERVVDLQGAYSGAADGPFPAGLIRSALLRDVVDPTLWRVQTLWASRDHLTAMRAAGKPKGIQMFEAAGATPSLGVFEIVAELTPSGDAA